MTSIPVDTSGAAARQHRAGLALIAAAAISWSTSGFFVRLITADLMTMLFWRGIFSGAAVAAIFLAIEGGRARETIGRMSAPAFAVMALCSIGMISGIGSLRFAQVAEALTIYATLPFIAAAMAWAFIGEKPKGRVLIASLVALAGVGIMLKDSSWDGSLFGKFLALIMATSMASMTVIMRRHPDVPMLPAMAGAAWLTSFICFWFAAPLSISLGTLGLIAVFGVFQNAAGLALYSFGSRLVPSAEATLIAALEVPLTPLWVLLIFSEVPSNATLIGGGVVLAAMFGHIVSEMRAGR